MVFFQFSFINCLLFFKFSYLDGLFVQLLFNNPEYLTNPKKIMVSIAENEKKKLMKNILPIGISSIILFKR